MEGSLEADSTQSSQTTVVMSVADLLSRQGQGTSVGGNRLIRLDDPAVVWLVASGQVDLFSVQTEPSDLLSNRFHVASVQAGHLIFGFPSVSGEGEVVILAVTRPRTELVRLGIQTIHNLLEQPEYTESILDLVDTWVEDLSAELGAHRCPLTYVAVKADEQIALEGGEALQPADGVLWMTALGGTTRFMGVEELPVIEHRQSVPLCSNTWIEPLGRVGMSAQRTKDFAQDREKLWQGLADFHNLVRGMFALQLHEARTRQDRQLAEAMKADRRLHSSALGSLRRVLVQEEGESEIVEGDPLLQTFSMVGSRLGIEIRPPRVDGLANLDPIQGIAQASRISVREVVLTGKWWKQDLGPLLGFMAEDGSPAALLDRKPGSYLLVDPSTGTKTRVTAKVASGVKPKAWMLIRPLPDRAVTGSDLLKLGIKGCIRDLLRIFLMAAAAGLLALVVPVATGNLFDEIVPSEDHAQLIKLVGALSVALVSSALFQLVQCMAHIRIEGKMVWTLQCAVWDRILALPVGFFRQFNAGDLANRSLGVDQIRQMLTETAVTTIVTAVFSVFQVGLLFYYSIELAIVAAVAAVVLLVLPAVCLLIQFRYQRPLLQVTGRIQGLTLQLLNGISKLRVHAAEERAFHVWASEFSKQKQLFMKAGRIGNILSAYSQALGVTSILIILVWAFWNQDSLLRNMTTGHFLAFVSAFTTAISSAQSLLTTLLPLLSIVPSYERTRPILDTPPEVTSDKADPGELRGRLDLSQVSFRYRSDGPLVTKNVSLEVKPREFVALVGPSGSGKTTLLRLMLGFEQPESGSILYDHQALNQLDVQAVRRQIGVVLQNSILVAGSILENIVGSAPLTIDRAWEALRLVDLEESVKRMPMGIYTIIGEGGAGLSGGERQRLLMARALVKRPRLIFFDEATSALDNQSQAWVSRSLESLRVTRVVIAQRLSTTKNADRIYVVVDGQIVETGSFEELMLKGAVFSELARRQLT